ncbi:gliding motility lipoprotein GldD [Phaeocystidibacter marisrubri]|uniref:Gliding motility lipoprotein GldD n=2 Tax=Phaeocystidibacter marisrubri TaxID=1577780 RepID=A0A6L3ZDY8_9FLAO|nr:gliding motility lipoprotein GldD [Phaeocystidibacter marisrubri]
MMRMHKLTLAVLAILGFASCDNESTPRPFGYMRIDLPSTEYAPVQMASDCPYTFDMNTEAEWAEDKGGTCWGDVNYPSIKAQIQLTYKDLNTVDFGELLDEVHDLAYKHSVRADGIRDEVFSNAKHDVYGLLYRMKGEAATTTQFFVTDSTDHFLRGVVYFYASPNPDSLKPVDEFMANEVVKMMESTRWKNK